MSRLPQASGAEVVSLIQSLGYQFVRQRGSRARYRLAASVGTHNITLRMHRVVAKGTLNDILRQVSLWTGVPKDELIKQL